MIVKHLLKKDIKCNSLLREITFCFCFILFVWLCFLLLFYSFFYIFYSKNIYIFYLNTFLFFFVLFFVLLFCIFFLVFYFCFVLCFILFSRCFYPYYIANGQYNSNLTGKLFILRQVSNIVQGCISQKHHYATMAASSIELCFALFDHFGIRTPE